MRYLLLIYALTVVLVVGIAGQRGDTTRRPPIELFPDMDRMPKLRPQAHNPFFADGLSSRLPVPGTVARGTAYEDAPANTGRIPGTTNFVDALPVPVTLELLNRGRERYGIYCAVCHGAIGDGKGITSKYGMAAVANLHDLRLIKMADGEIFNTITYGKNLMGSYAAQVSIPDRWAIVAYVRALQRSRLATLEDLPPDKRGELPGVPQPAAVAPK